MRFPDPTRKQSLRHDCPCRRRLHRYHPHPSRNLWSSVPRGMGRLRRKLAATTMAGWSAPLSWEINKVAWLVLGLALAWLASRLATL